MICPICGGATSPLGVVDFSKSCEEARGRILPPSGVAVSYQCCEDCGFCFAPEIARWSLEEFEQRIYNDGYAQVDPDYRDARPRANAANLAGTFGERSRSIRHLDYGGGSGLMSRLLRESGWQSRSYDPFVDRGLDPASLGGFDLVTAYEVFEHVPDVKRLAAELSALLDGDGLILFSTLVSDGHLGPGGPLDWWYAAPRNGHISLYSRQSLALLGASEGFNFMSFSDVSHAWWRAEVPLWARHVMQASGEAIQ